MEAYANAIGKTAAALSEVMTFQDLPAPSLAGDLP